MFANSVKKVWAGDLAGVGAAAGDALAEISVIAGTVASQVVTFVEEEEKGLNTGNFMGRYQPELSAVEEAQHPEAIENDESGAVRPWKSESNGGESKKEVQGAVRLRQGQISAREDMQGQLSAREDMQGQLSAREDMQGQLSAREDMQRQLSAREDMQGQLSAREDMQGQLSAREDEPGQPLAREGVQKQAIEDDITKSGRRLKVLIEDGKETDKDVKEENKVSESKLVEKKDKASKSEVGVSENKVSEKSKRVSESKLMEKKDKASKREAGVLENKVLEKSEKVSKDKLVEEEDKVLKSKELQKVDKVPKSKDLEKEDKASKSKDKKSGEADSWKNEVKDFKEEQKEFRPELKDFIPKIKKGSDPPNKIKAPLAEPEEESKVKTTITVENVNDETDEQKAESLEGSGRAGEVDHSGTGNISVIVTSCLMEGGDKIMKERGFEGCGIILHRGVEGERGHESEGNKSRVGVQVVRGDNEVDCSYGEGREKTMGCENQSTVGVRASLVFSHSRLSTLGANGLAGICSLVSLDLSSNMSDTVFDPGVNMRRYARFQQVLKYNEGKIPHDSSREQSDIQNDDDKNLSSKKETLNDLRERSVENCKDSSEQSNDPKTSGSKCFANLFHCNIPAGNNTKLEYDNIKVEKCDAKYAKVTNAENALKTNREG